MFTFPDACRIALAGVWTVAGPKPCRPGSMTGQEQPTMTPSKPQIDSTSQELSTDVTTRLNALIDRLSTHDDDENRMSPQQVASELRGVRAGLTASSLASMSVKVTPNEKGNPPGKLADAELHFGDGPLAGLKLIGFAVWERRGGGNNRNVTFPARQYSVNGERRSFALLRPIQDTDAQTRIRDLILDAYATFEAEQVTTV